MTENAVTWLFQTGVERIKGCREASFWFDARLHASGASLIRPSQRKSLSSSRALESEESRRRFQIPLGAFIPSPVTPRCAGVGFGSPDYRGLLVGTVPGTEANRY